MTAGVTVAQARDSEGHPMAVHTVVSNAPTNGGLSANELNGIT